MYMSLFVFVSRIYLFIERERERERKKELQPMVALGFGNQVTNLRIVEISGNFSTLVSRVTAPQKIL